MKTVRYISMVAVIILAFACSSKSKISEDGESGTENTDSGSGSTGNTTDSEPSLSISSNVSEANDDGTVSLTGQFNLDTDTSYSYSWTQTAGLRTKISGSDTLIASITIPGLIGDYTNTYELVVSKDGETVLSDTITVELKDDGSRGYQDRPCGFDLNQNGKAGEMGECQVCNGIVTDLDGDGNDEDFHYVDTVNGNNGNDGSASSPYATLQYAMDNADGDGNGIQDIICFYGTETGSLVHKQSGVANVQLRGTVEYPSNPFLIAGWDKDQDGEYPPYDTDDLALFDNFTGGPPTEAIAIDVNTNPQQYLEFAHFTVVGYENGRAMDLNDTGSNYVYTHDLKFADINPNYANVQAMDVYETDGNDHAVENVEMVNVCCMGVEFDGQDYQANNISITLNANDVGYGIYGWTVSNLHAFDNKIDGGASDWTGSIGVLTGIADSNSGTNNTYTNNHIHNFEKGIMIGQNGSSINAVDNIIINGNLITNDATVDAGFTNPVGIYIGNGAGGNHIEDVFVTNNIIHTFGAFLLYSCIHERAGITGGAQSGVVTIAGNSCIGSGNTANGLYLDGNFSSRRDDYMIQNNIFDGITSRNIVVYHPSNAFDPSTFYADGNIYDSSATYDWAANTNVALATAKLEFINFAISNDKECAPAFVNAAAGDFELTAGDTCARSSGSDISAFTTVDYLNRTRKTVLPTSGALESP